MLKHSSLSLVVISFSIIMEINVKSKGFVALLLGALIAIVTAVAHMSCIVIGPSCFKAQLAPPHIVRSAMEGTSTAVIETIIVSSLFLACAFFAISGAAVISVAGLPQLWRMYKSKSSQNLSVIMWILLFYGLLPLWIREVVWVQNPIFIFQITFSQMVNILAIVLIFYYRYFYRYSQEGGTS